MGSGRGGLRVVIKINLSVEVKQHYTTINEIILLQFLALHAIFLKLTILNWQCDVNAEDDTSLTDEHMAGYILDSCCTKDLKLTLI